MEKSKTEQYTFGADEKETLQKMATVESSIGQNMQEKNERELIAINYYSEFVINTQNGPITLNNVFITQEKDEKGQLSYHFRWITENENGEQIVEEKLVVDENGKVHATGALKEYFGDEEIDIEKLIAENNVVQGRLKGISEKAEPEDISKGIKKQKEKDEKENSDEKQEDEEEEKPEEQIEKDLGEEDLEISYYRKIEDKNLDNQMKNDFSGYEEKGIAYSKTKDAFIMVGKKDGKFQMVDGFEPAKPTFKTVMSIDEKGKTVEKKVPHALMKTSNDKKEMSITIGQYGYIEAGTVDRLPCNERVEMQLQEEGETQQGRTDPQLMRSIERNGTEAVHSWVHEHEEANEQMDPGDTRKEDVTEEIQNDGEHIEDEKYIPGTDITWRQFANECGYRGEGSIEHAQKVFEEERNKPENQDKSNDELVEDIVEEKNEEFHEQSKK